jgi:hypothetical protein
MGLPLPSALDLCAAARRAGVNGRGRQRPELFSTLSASEAPPPYRPPHGTSRSTPDVLDDRKLSAAPPTPSREPATSRQLRETQEASGTSRKSGRLHPSGRCCILMHDRSMHDRSVKPVAVIPRVCRSTFENRGQRNVIEWTGITTDDPKTGAQVHQAIVNGLSMTVYFSLEVIEDHGLDAAKTAAERKIASTSSETTLPRRIEVTNADI